jgi:hypothetical protein
MLLSLGSITRLHKGKLMNTSKFAKLGLAFAATVAIVFSFAQTGNHSQHRPGTKPQTGSKGGGMHMDMAKCMADMKAGTAKLDKLAAKMNSAKGAAKIDATAAVVNEMLAQRKQMDTMCMQMMSHMSGSHGGAKPGTGTGGHKHGG